MARLDSLPQDLRERAEGNGSKPTEAPSGVELLANLIGFIRRYVVLSTYQALLIALWIVHTHALGAADTTAYLNIRSAEKRSGKTRLLEILSLGGPTVVDGPGDRRCVGAQGGRGDAHTSA